MLDDDSGIEFQVVEWFRRGNKADMGSELTTNDLVLGPRGVCTRVRGEHDGRARRR
jgi:hypothetical protein